MLNTQGFPPDPKLWEGCLKSQTFLCESPEFAGQGNHLYHWVNFIRACSCRAKMKTRLTQKVSFFVYKDSI